MNRTVFACIGICVSSALASAATIAARSRRVDKVCIWTWLPLRPGANVITASITVEGRTISDSVTWNGPDPAQGIRIDTGDSITRAIGGNRFGSRLDPVAPGGQIHHQSVQSGLRHRHRGPALRTLSGTPAAYFSKFFLNRSASFFAWAS